MGTLVRTLYMYLLCDATNCEDEDMRIKKQYETDVINANITLMQIIARRTKICESRINAKLHVMAI
jgi:hypothetical protein